MKNTPARLEFMPVTFFALVMGLTGITLVWQRYASLYGLPVEWVAHLLLALSALAFLSIAGAYGLKYLRHPVRVHQEFAHPIKLSFFPAITISLILLGTATVKLAPGLSFALWAVGAAGQLLFTLSILSAWLYHDKFQIQHSNPAWFIPVVGNILVPIAGVQHAHPEISWFYFSVGLIFWVVLQTVLFYRLIFHPPLPEKLTPTLFILIAPPAVGFSAYLGLTGSLDPLARILFYTGLFIFLLLIFQLQRFWRLKFYLSWWAYSFPLAALALAVLGMYQHTQLALFGLLGHVMVGMVSIVIGLLLVRTLQAMLRQQICHPEE